MSQYYFDLLREIRGLNILPFDLEKMVCGYITRCSLSEREIGEIRDIKICNMTKNNNGIVIFDYGNNMYIYDEYLECTEKKNINLCIERISRYQDKFIIISFDFNTHHIYQIDNENKTEIFKEISNPRNVVVLNNHIFIVNYDKMFIYEGYNKKYEWVISDTMNIWYDFAVSEDEIFLAHRFKGILIVDYAGNMRNRFDIENYDRLSQIISYYDDIYLNYGDYIKVVTKTGKLNRKISKDGYTWRMAINDTKLMLCNDNNIKIYELVYS